MQGKTKNKYLIIIGTLITVTILLLINLKVSAVEKNDIEFIDATYLKPQFVTNEEFVTVRDFRYRYTFDLENEKDTKDEYWLEVSIDYDFLPLEPMSDEELNEVIEEKVRSIEQIFSESNKEELFTSEGIVENSEKVNEFLDYNKDERVYFMYYISAYKYDFEGAKLIDFPQEELDKVYNELYDIETLYDLMENDSALQELWNKKY